MGNDGGLNRDNVAFVYFLGKLGIIDCRFTKYSHVMTMINGQGPQMPPPGEYSYTLPVIDLSVNRIDYYPRKPKFV